MFLHADSEDSDLTGRMPRLNLSLRWAERLFCWICLEAAHLCSERIVFSSGFKTAISLSEVGT